MRSKLMPIPMPMFKLRPMPTPRPCSSLMLSLLSRRRPLGVDLGVRLWRAAREGVWLVFPPEELGAREERVAATGVIGGGKSEPVVNMLWL